MTPNIGALKKLIKTLLYSSFNLSIISKFEVQAPIFRTPAEYCIPFAISFNLSMISIYGVEASYIASREYTITYVAPQDPRH